ncbi:hypothetical protein CHS0354_013840 [Potamilus streckersoni]|uniref:Pyroglutamyl-peptidase I n=1 Tax=Potamilus streckersoni TaxID=2493646 RepID=A0AAE0W8S6_9BIVA|nr:hypothetical protein CHS0354_013840 [Potamilus streckersoni]
MPAQVEPSKKTVLVTGFGPFGVYKVNTSWEAVKELYKQGLGVDWELVIEEIPVEYCTVKSKVPKLWEKHNPHLVVHVGVSGMASELTLEQKAFNYGYEKSDVKGCLPDANCCVHGADECITAGIKMNIVCADINNSDSKVKAVVSHDAGRYLCDFSYFTSLHINKHRTAFIHVPPLDQPYTVQELAEGLKVAITAMLKQIEEKLQ